MMRLAFSRFHEWRGPRVPGGAVRGPGRGRARPRAARGRATVAVRRVVAETGILSGRRRRAVDSTILADAVATQDTITQLIAAIRRVGRIVPGAAEAIVAVCTGHDYSGPGKPSIDWNEPGAKDALVSAL